MESPSERQQVLRSVRKKKRYDDQGRSQEDASPEDEREFLNP